MSVALTYRSDRADPVAHLRRRAHIVAVLRVLLPAVAILLVVTAVLWPQFMGPSNGLSAPTVVPGKVDGADVMMMHEPRYIGRTSDGDPYELTARSAYMRPDRTSRIHLDRLVADIKTSERRDLRVEAVAGVYNRKAEKLQLRGGIELITSDGYRFETESARVDFRDREIIGRRHIEGSGPAGTLAANRFAITEGGDVLRFEGRVKVTMQPAADRGAE